MSARIRQLVLELMVAIATLYIMTPSNLTRSPIANLRSYMADVAGPCSLTDLIEEHA